MIGSIFIASQHVTIQVVVPIKTTTSARHTILDHRERIAKPGTLARKNQSMLIS
jgi:hypothetical protein